MKPGPYSILLSKFQNGSHSLTFELGDAFFQSYEPDFPDGNQVVVQAQFYKTDRLVDLKLHFSGYLMTPCDRCMELYPQRLNAKRRLIYTTERSQHTDSTDQADELLPLDPQNPVIHLDQELYDFACLALPHRRVPDHCPSDACPEAVLAYLAKLTSEPAHPPQEDSPEPVDPRWAALNKLRNNNS